MNTFYILAALAHQLGTPRNGDLAFTRCFMRDEITALLIDAANMLPSWRLRGVGATSKAGWITADQAVEIREDKGSAAMLLVDSASAGAGMDGIYNAAREVTEEALFGEAIRLVERDLKPNVRAFAHEAVRRAKRIGGRVNAVARRQEFDFYGALVADPGEAGRALPRLGVWPVAGPIEEVERYLPQAGLMVEKLLVPPATAQAPAVRVAGLVLEPTISEQRRALENLLRRAGAMPRLETLAVVAGDKNLWLGNLRPAFLNNKLVGIELIPWRQPKGGILKWSGLTQPTEEEPPQFVIDQTNPKCRLEVR